jgi:[protein-PII] uridylyltransferase
VRHARLCEPTVLGDAIRIAVVPTGSELWVIDVVAHDGVGLLASEAMAMADTGLDVRAATLAVWGDGVALASFQVRGGAQPSAAELEERIIRARRARRGTTPLDARVEFDHEGSPWHTLCRVRAADRTGLLFEIASAFSVAGVSVHAARISAEGATALDEFELTDRRGEKLGAADEHSVVEALTRGVVPVRRLRRWRAHRARAVNGVAAEFILTKHTSDNHEIAGP